MRRPLLLGAVAYDAKVVPIWETFAEHFRARGLEFDFVLYTNYERQVEAQFAGHIDVAWNSPLAWIETERIAAKLGRTPRALVMRDTDCDLTSVLVVQSDSPIRSVMDVRGRTVAVGASDSPQGTLLPLELLAEAGLLPEVDFVVQRHEIGLGKHGDHVGGERDAARALAAGEVDVACMIDGNHLQFTREGTLAAGATRILAQTPPYDHCNFTVLDGGDEAALGRFTRVLLEMSYDDPSVRPVLDMEGLKAWKPGRVTGYGQLARACDRFGGIDTFVADVAGRAPGRLA